MYATTSRALQAGRRLFNARRFFEAHEVWEEAWLRETGDTRRLLQALIQIAAGYHHAFERGRPHGCVRLLDAGSRRLETLADDAGGLALPAFREAVAASLTKALRWERGESGPPRPEEAPFLGEQRG